MKAIEVEHEPDLAMDGINDKLESLSLEDNEDVPVCDHDTTLSEIKTRLIARAGRA